MKDCGALVRGGGTCKLKVGHRGCHSSVVFTCDTCGRTLRGSPYVQEDVYAYGERDDTFAFCFLCAGPPAERAERRAMEGREV